jgi:hypothetical protein
MRSALGSIISDLKVKQNQRKDGGESDNQFSINNIIKRLEDYKKYQQTIQKEQRDKERKKIRKALKKIKKESFKRVYYRKPVINPYLHMYEKHHITVDPRLEERYNSRPLYSLFEFRHLHLPKSDYEIKAGQAWGGLINSWKGYKIAKDNEDRVLTKKYAFTTQRWAWMLELPMIPDFDESSLESFENSRRLTD